MRGIKVQGLPAVIVGEAPDCPKCGQKSRVYKTRGSKRNRECLDPACGFRYVTQEAYQADIDQFTEWSMLAGKIIQEGARVVSGNQ